MKWFEINRTEIFHLINGGPSLQNWESGSELVFAYRDASLTAQWDALASRARPDNDTRQAHLVQLITRQQEIADLYRRRDALAIELQGNVWPATKDAAWTAFRIEIERALAADAPAVKGVLDRFEAMDGPDLLADLARLIDLCADANDAAAKRELTMLSGSTLALAVARFNQHFLSDTTPARSSPAFHDEVKASLEMTERQVWQALVNEDLAGASGLALAWARVASGHIEEAIIHVAAAAHQRRAATANIIAEGRFALTLSALLGELMRAVTVGWYVAWLTNGYAKQEAIQSCVSAAKTRPFATAAAAPSIVDFSALAGRADGDLVSIEGVVGAMDLLDPNDVSMASVSNGQGGTVDIFSSHARLDAHGMSPGAYIRVSGRWQRASSALNGPALLVDNVPVVDLEDANWSDWVTDQTRLIFATTELATQCSWEPGDDGAANALQYGTWFVA